jgi:hypothetical protein
MPIKKVNRVPPKTASIKRKSEKKSLPKRNSAKTASPKRKSVKTPKRKSAKTASPKRKSAKTASPKRKSAKTASPKRKSAKAASASPKRKSAKKTLPKRKSVKTASPKRKSATTPKRKSVLTLSRKRKSGLVNAARSTPRKPPTYISKTPKPVAVPAPKPVAVPAPKPVAVPVPKPIAVPAPITVVVPAPATVPVPKSVAAPAPATEPAPALVPVRPSYNTLVIPRVSTNTNAELAAAAKSGRFLDLFEITQQEENDAQLKNAAAIANGHSLKFDGYNLVDLKKSITDINNMLYDDLMDYIIQGLVRKQTTMGSLPVALFSTDIGLVAPTLDYMAGFNIIYDGRVNYIRNSLQKSIIFAPMYIQKRGHYILAIVDVKQKRVYILDPLTHRNNLGDTLNHVKTYFQYVDILSTGLFKFNNGFSNYTYVDASQVMPGSIPQQTDGISCGFYVVGFVYWFLKYRGIPTKTDWNIPAKEASNKLRIFILATLTKM